MAKAEFEQTKIEKEEGEVKKAVILAGGLGTRFLPLSKVIPKELWPLVDKPLIHYLLREVKQAGIKEVIFVLPSKESATYFYFKKNPDIREILKKNNREDILSALRELDELQEDLSISYVIQKKPLGDGDAVLKVRSKVKKEPFALLFSDDIIDFETPAIKQLLKLFKTSQRPVIGLYRVSKEQIPFLGMTEVESIAHRFFKIKSIKEKPSLQEAPSDLAIVGRYILTSEIFEFLKRPEIIKKTGKIINKTGEIVVAEALEAALQAGKAIYGYEIKGEWLRCGDKRNWLRSHLYLSLKDPRFGKMLEQYLKEIT